jgi:transposase-like protein
MEAKKLDHQNVIEISVNIKHQLWEEIEKVLLSVLKSLLETFFNDALQEQIGAEPYQRTSKRKDYRNGSYSRSLTTKFGHIPDLRIPRMRGGSLSQEIVERYELIRNSVQTKPAGFGPHLIAKKLSAVSRNGRRNGILWQKVR